MTPQQATQNLIGSYQRAAQVQTQIEQAQRNLAQLQAQHAQAKSDYLQAVGTPDSQCLYSGFLIAVKDGAVTVTPPQPTIISVTTK